MLSLRIDDRQWVKLGDLFANIDRGLPRAIRQGVQDAGNKTLTQVRRALKEQTGVRLYSSITKRTGAGTQADGMFVIYAKGPAIPIKEFPVFTTSKGVVAYSWGVSHEFKRSYRSKSGRYMARLTSKHEPTRPLLGPNLAKELGKSQSHDAFVFWTSELLVPAIVKRIGRVLG